MKGFGKGLTNTTLPYLTQYVKFSYIDDQPHSLVQFERIDIPLGFETEVYIRCAQTATV